MTDDGGGDGGPPERDEVLELLEDGLREAHRKVTSGRVYNPEHEQVRISWIRALAYSAGQYRQLKKDQQIDELEERIEEIDSQQNSSSEFRFK